MAAVARVGDLESKSLRFCLALNLPAIGTYMVSGEKGAAPTAISEVFVMGFSC